MKQHAEDELRQLQANARRRSRPLLIAGLALAATTGIILSTVHITVGGFLAGMCAAATFVTGLMYADERFVQDRYQRDIDELEEVRALLSRQETRPAGRDPEAKL